MIASDVSSLTGEIDRSFWLVGAVTVALLVITTGAMIVFAIRYRRSRRRIAEQVHGHIVLEIIWIAVPTLIVLWMFVVGLRPFLKARAIPRGAYTIQVTGRQWVWSFHYPDSGVDSTQMVVPANTDIRLELTSMPTDVIHGFFLPDFRLKQDALPGQLTYLWLNADRLGTFDIFCTQYCGKDHSQMHTLMKVVGPGEFTAWVEAQIAKRYRPVPFEAVAEANWPGFGPADLNIDSKVLYDTFCLSCHGANGDGSGLPGQARDFRSPARWKHSPKVTDIFRTLVNGVPGSQMRPFPSLTPCEKVALGHYVRHFLATTPPADSRADFEKLVQEFGLDQMRPPPRPLPIEEAMEELVRHGQPGAPASQPQAQPK
jgi:cytochrome c oxidase subunit II